MVLVVLAVLALGLACTVCIAWLPGLLGADESGTGLVARARLGESGRLVATAYVRKTWWSLFIEVWTHKEDWPELRDLLPSSVLPSWRRPMDTDVARRVEPTRFMTNAPVVFSREYRGWPMPALWCEYRPQLHGGWRWTEASGLRGVSKRDYGRAVPYRVLLSGMIIDVVFWSLPFGALAWVLEARRERRRRGYS